MTTGTHGTSLEWAGRVTRGNTGRIPNGARTLTTPTGVYKYRVGKSCVQVWTPNGYKYTADLPAVLGMPWSVIESLQVNHYWKRSASGGAPVTPSIIRKLIERNFEPAFSRVE